VGGQGSGIDIGEKRRAWFYRGISISAGVSRLLEDVPEIRGQPVPIVLPGSVYTMDTNVSHVNIVGKVEMESF